MELLGLFPGESGAAEMTVGGGLLVDGLLQIQCLDDFSRAKIEVLLHNLQKLLLALRRRAVAEDGDGEGLGDTDGVGDLDQDALAEAGLDEGLGDPAGGISGGTIDLGEVLAREGATSMSSPSSVCVDDDLSSGESGVSHGTSDDELARRLQVEDGVVIHVLGWDDFLDDEVHEGILHLSQLLMFVMLDGNDYGVDALGDAGTILEGVFGSDLGLGVGSEPLASSVASEVGHSLVKLVGEDDGEGHSFLGLIRSVAEHKSLISGTGLVLLTANVDALGDVWGLLLESNEDVAGLVVESLGRVIVADVFDRVTDDLLVVDNGLRRDLAANEDHASLGDRFAGDFGVGILLEMSIEDGIRDLIADLVGMTLSDGLGCEEERLNVLLSDFRVLEIRHFLDLLVVGV